MAGNDKRRQKKLERRNAKRKERRRTLVKQKNRGLAERLLETNDSPILDSLVSETTWDEGMGQALLSRQLPNGDVAFGMFLLDTYCLGVKNAFGNVVSKAEYRAFLDDLEDRYEFVELPPEDVRCLIEDAVEFARDLGFEPHPDYRRVKPIFGDLDPLAAKERFEFGDDSGKPHFMAGPYDDPQRCYKILSILEHSCGKEGFNYTLPFVEGIPESLRDRARTIRYDDDGNIEDDDFDDDDS